MCARCIDRTSSKVEELPSYIYITRYGALAILNELVQRRWIDQGAVKNLWQDLKELHSVLLVTGAKLFRDREGNIGVGAYAWNHSDIAPYMQYQLKEV